MHINPEHIGKNDGTQYVCERCKKPILEGQVLEEDGEESRYGTETKPHQYQKVVHKDGKWYRVPVNIKQSS